MFRHLPCSPAIYSSQNKQKSKSQNFNFHFFRLILHTIVKYCEIFGNILKVSDCLFCEIHIWQKLSILLGIAHSEEFELPGGTGVLNSRIAGLETKVYKYWQTLLAWKKMFTKLNKYLQILTSFAGLETKCVQKQTNVYEYWQKIASLEFICKTKEMFPSIGTNIIRIEAYVWNCRVVVKQFKWNFV